MLPRYIVPTLVVFSFAIVFSSIFIVELNTNYGTDINTDWVDTYNKLDEASGLAEDVKSSVDTTDKGLIEGAADLLFSGTINVLKLIINSFATFALIISRLLQQSLSIDSRIADPLGSGLIACLVSSMIFAVVSSVIKGKL